MKKMMRILINFSFLLFYTQPLSEFQNSLENSIQNLATLLNEAYGKRCQQEFMECQIKSFNACEGTSAKQCYDDFPSPVDCDFNTQHGALMSRLSSIRFPLNVDPKQLSNQNKQFVCITAFMENGFKKLNNDRNFRYGLAYVGTTSGSFRSYPSFSNIDEETSQCLDYDPRVRPWFKSTISGGKNLIIIVDTSQSMFGRKLTQAKKAIRKVLNTLNINDFVGVVEFNSKARSLYSSKILRATNALKQNLNKKVQLLEAQGETNYELSFQKAFSMLDEAQDDEYGAPCFKNQNIFLFLTDGEPTIGKRNSFNLVQAIKQRNEQYNITIFTYGVDTDAEILSVLACKFKGIMFNINSSDSEIAIVMEKYYQYIAERVNILDPMWSQPYNDFFGFGRITTVSLPIYYEENGSKKILGVAGIDISLPALIDDHYKSEKQIMKQLLKGKICKKNSVDDECKYETQRPLYKKCGFTSCAFEIDNFTECQILTNDIFQEPVDTSHKKCCGFSFALIISFSFIAITGLTIIIICSVVKTQQKKEKSLGKKSQKETLESERAFSQNKKRRILRRV